MKILFITSFLTRSAGGLYNSVSGLAKALAGHGVQIEVAGAADAHFTDDKPIWEPVPIRPHPAAGIYGLRPGVFTDLLRERFDLVHVHGIWSANSVYGRAAVLRGIPTIVSPRGMLDPWILDRRPLVKRVHAALFERPLMRRAHIHALNHSEQEAIGEFMPSAAPRTFVVPNGVPESLPGKSDSARSGALFLGRLHEKKQVLELIRAWREAIPPHGPCLTVAGWGDPAYEAAVRRAAGSAANVEFVGPLHGAAKTAALFGARYFILPSLSEGLPMAVLEAIQHGCIPIITAQCNLPELVRDGIALPMEHDFSDFHEVIARALALPEQEAVRRSAAAMSYAGRYAWPKIALEMIGCYENCIAHARG